MFEREGKREHLDICELLLALVEIYSMRSLCSDHLRVTSSFLSARTPDEVKSRFPCSDLSIIYFNARSRINERLVQCVSGVFIVSMVFLNLQWCPALQNISHFNMIGQSLKKCLCVVLFRF